MNSSPIQKYVAEFVGTFVLVFLGCGTAMLLGCNSGGGYIATALAFGLSIVAMAYSIGNVSGCHVNPAVSLAVFINGGLSKVELGGYRSEDHLFRSRHYGCDCRQRRLGYGCKHSCRCR